MSAARSSDGLLPAAQALSLLGLLKRHPSGVAEDQVLRDLTAIVAASWSRGRNSINKLVQYGVIARDRGQLFMAEPAELHEAQTQIATRTVEELIDRIASHEAWNCVRLDQQTGTAFIDMMAVPAMHDGLATWLVEFGIASREGIESRHWQVAGAYVALFISSAESVNDARPRRSKSAEQLAKELAEQSAMGLAAELWVVEYEKRRLSCHPLRRQIRQVSERDVAAGYDIASFSSPESLRHDLFIEVKSFGSAKRFHWSRNEIATARDFGDEYALYLVDRGRVDERDYAPQVILGPTPELFTAADSGWRVEATSFEHVEVGE